jgi:hypothetical protein
MFCLVEIPTVGSRSSQEGVVVDVKKWDKQIVGEEMGSIFLNMRFRVSGFLKRGQVSSV